MDWCFESALVIWGKGSGEGMRGVAQAIKTSHKKTIRSGSVHRPTLLVWEYLRAENQWARTDLNCRPHRYQRCALPTELRALRVTSIAPVLTIFDAHRQSPAQDLDGFGIFLGKNHAHTRVSPLRSMKSASNRAIPSKDSTIHERSVWFFNTTTEPVSKELP